MSDMDDPRFGLGGNNPPEPMETLAAMLTPAVLRDQLELDYPHMVARRDELLAGAERFFATVKTIETIEQQARAADFKKQFDLLYADVETARKVEVKPLDDAKKVHQKFFKAEILDPIEREANDINAKLTVFQRKETARVAAEHAAEQKRLKEAAAAAAAAALASQRPSMFEDAAKAAKAAEAGPAKVTAAVRGAASTTSLRAYWTFEETDLSKVPREYLILDRARIQAEINGGLRDGADGAPAIDGLRIFNDAKAIVR